VKVLLVDPDVIRGPSLKMALAAAGAEVTQASSGSFALTMLDWNRHDVVLSLGHIGDMDGHELCSILKSDPSTQDVRFVLVADGDEVSEPDRIAAGVDLVLPASLPAAGIMPLLTGLVRAQSQAPSALAPPAPTPTAVPTSEGELPAASTRTPEPLVPKLRPDPVTAPVPEPPRRYVTAAAAAAAAPWSVGAPGPAAAPVLVPERAATATPPAPARHPASGPTGADLLAVPSGTFQGSLEVMDLADLTQAIGMGGKSGRLILATPQGGGLIVFDAGQVVHAEYRGAVGEPAFAALVSASHSGGPGRFCFLPSAVGDKPPVSRTIDKSVDRLLLSIATAIDEKG
jgi:CheY-like chemotaxis protein